MIDEKDDRPDAALQREMKLRDQRPYLKDYNTGAGGPANLWFVKTSRSSKSFLPLGASAYRFVTPARCHSKPRVGARRRRHPRGSDWDNKS